MSVSITANPRQADRARLADRLIDGAERLLVLALFIGLVVRLVAGYRLDGRVGNLFLLPSEGLVVVLLLIRRGAGEISRRPGEWILALGGTCLPMAVAPGTGSPVPPVIGVVILLMGMIMQVHAKLVLGRSFGCIPAHRGLKRGGPYQFVRHPMYAGYLLSHLGFLAMNPTWRNLALYAACYALQVPRLLAEERLLGHDPNYRSYQAEVPYRLIPGVF